MKFVDILISSYAGSSIPSFSPASFSFRSHAMFLPRYRIIWSPSSSFLTSSGASDLFIDYEEWERTGLTKGENIRLVMERNRFPQAIYVGDTQKDQDAARLAGIPFIHAAYGFGRVQSPDAVIRSLAELPDVIDAMAASL